MSCGNTEPEILYEAVIEYDRKTADEKTKGTYSDAVERLGATAFDQKDGTFSLLFFSPAIEKESLSTLLGGIKVVSLDEI